ncbi:hypothetical protein SXCC_04235 [Gluconacetobacter sp. SXCC-1]|nr:hypothetical protein SXCC_04235 [Gluconacetobacter sp. SXCC-1]
MDIPENTYCTIRACTPRNRWNYEITIPCCSQFFTHNITNVSKKIHFSL